MALITGLIAYWKMDEAAWNIIDSVWGHDGTIGTWVWYGAGKINNGTTYPWWVNWNNFQVANDVPFFLSDFSVSYREKSTATKGYRIYYWWDNAGEMFMIWNDFSWVSNKLNVLMLDKWNTEYTSAMDINDWAWHHVVVTVDSTWAWAIKCYIDGLIANWFNQVIAWQMSWANRLYLWYRRKTVPGYETFNGTMDELGRWNRVLTATEASQLYNSWAWLPYPLVVTWNSWWFFF